MFQMFQLFVEGFGPRRKLCAERVFVDRRKEVRHIEQVGKLVFSRSNDKFCYIIFKFKVRFWLWILCCIGNNLFRLNIGEVLYHLVYFLVVNLF
jgi:hypothetical protein